MSAKSPHFSVIAATYNAEPWLAAFFHSLTTQSIGFDQHIEIIIVDDGSTDNGAAVVKKWIAQFPHNISLICQENAGPAAARNRGLEVFQGEWVTFIDPDDFVSENYFATVAAFLHETPEFNGFAAACRFVYYNEAHGTVSDTHPLNFKFFEERTVVDLSDRPEYIQVSAATCFFRGSVLKNSDIRFDDRVRPGFEDGHFISRLFLATEKTKIAFLRDAVYFYRKRSEADSLVDTAWQKREKYFSETYYGLLDTAKQAESKFGKAPHYIQNVLIYCLQWYIKRMIDKKLSYPFTCDERQRFFDILRLIASHIDADVILFSKLPTLSLPTRIAMLCALKDLSPGGLPFFVEAVSADGSSMRIIHYSGKEEDCVYLADGKAVTPLWERRLVHDFYGSILYTEYRMRLPLYVEAELSFSANGTEAALIYNGESFAKVRGKALLEAADFVKSVSA